MAKFQDLTNKKFGRLLVIKRAEDHIKPCGKHVTMWLCKCECGNEVVVQAGSLKRGHTTSCGCFHKEKISKHGLTHTRLHNIWAEMKARCYNPNNKRYKNYGGRGIKICDEWKDNFQNFYNWSISNDYSEDLTIDRIDVNKGYFPENCRWITNKEQQRNRTNNRIITINGESHCLSKWCKILNLNYVKVKSRLNQLHWSVERALEFSSNK